jgi:hypothetical protein
MAGAPVAGNKQLRVRQSRSPASNADLVVVRREALWETAYRPRSGACAARFVLIYHTNQLHRGREGGQ